MYDDAFCTNKFIDGIIPFLETVVLCILTAYQKTVNFMVTARWRNEWRVKTKDEKTHAQKFIQEINRWFIIVS
jgi:hypothetical protein